MHSSRLLASVLAVSSFAAAYQPFVDFDSLAGFSGISDVILRRQNNDQPNDEQPAEETAAQETARPANTDSTDQPQETGSDNNNNDEENTTRGTAVVTGRPTRTNNNEDSAETTEFDQRSPPGGVSMVTPNPVLGQQFYKVGENVTFAWNYTSLLATPQFIDIMATNTKNQGLYTVAVNQSAEETSVVWDTQATQTVPFLTETYTLIIYDAESSISATPRPGYLAANNALVFAMYTPQNYVPLNEFQCPTCNRNAGGQLTAGEKQTLTLMLSMATLTILSFGYFGSVFGVFAI